MLGVHMGVALNGFGFLHLAVFTKSPGLLFLNVPFFVSSQRSIFLLLLSALLTLSHFLWALSLHPEETLLPHSLTTAVSSVLVAPPSSTALLGFSHPVLTVLS